MPLVTVEQLRKRLDWPDVREEPMPEYGMRWFRAIPKDESLPSVDFLFDDAVEFLSQIGSGQWHCHPTSVDDAIELARKLIHHEMCILEEHNADEDGPTGGYSKDGPVRADEVFETLRADAAYFVRRFFGRSATREGIDFSKYLKSRLGYITPAHRATIEASFAKMGRQPPPL
jgi:hypothetical protein